MVAGISTAIELNPELASLAYEMGLDASKICENALKQAIGRLQGLSVQNRMVDGASFPSLGASRLLKTGLCDLRFHV